MTSHGDISKKNFKRHKLIVNGLRYIISKESAKLTAKEIEKSTTIIEGGELINYLTDRNALSGIVFNLDVQKRFSEESLMYQKKLSCLIGQEITH